MTTPPSTPTSTASPPVPSAEEKLKAKVAELEQDLIRNRRYHEEEQARMAKKVEVLDSFGYCAGSLVLWSVALAVLGMGVWLVVTNLRHLATDPLNRVALGYLVGGFGAVAGACGWIDHRHKTPVLP